jgi:lysophospholipase L1-like esterase
MRTRFGQVTRHTFHDHQDVRSAVIKAQLQQVDNPVVVIGDSITEMARLPDRILGHQVINAGIGGLTIDEFIFLGPRLLRNSKPALIAIALGANDANSVQAGADYSELLRVLQPFAQKIVAVASTMDPLTEELIGTAAAALHTKYVPMKLSSAHFSDDKVHLNASGYRKWLRELEDAIIGELDNPK